MGCNSPLSGERYVEWVTDRSNGLHTTYVSEDISIDVQYKPWEYVWLQDQNFNPIARSTAQVELGGLHYVTLRIKPLQSSQDIVKLNASNLSDVQSNLYYFSYLFQQDIFLEENGKRKPVVLYHFEESSDLKTERTFHLGFENDGKSNDAFLIIESEKIFSLPIRIQINKKNIPELKI